MVAQIDEQDAAMIALVVDPAGQADALVDIVLGQLGAGVCAIGVHRKTFQNRCYGARGRIAPDRGRAALRSL
jgi:hypothetical protein